MKTTIGASLVLLSSALSMDSLAADPYPLRDAVEFTVRGGCPNVFRKLTDGASVKIAYLGGSITAQNGWRPKTLKWFQDEFPKAQVEQIHAAIGGTGSDLGVYRLDLDVLQHKPDLLFVEFAVNDGGAAPERIHCSMEGIVRKTWAFDPAIDICFVYTLTQGMLADLQSGKYPRAASAMEELADFYSIPSIHMGLKVAQMEKEGKVIFKESKPQPERLAAMENGIYYFSQDGVHPYEDTGHILYLEAVARAMTEIRTVGKPGPHTLAAPFRADNWEDAKMIPFGEAVLSAGWRELNPQTDDMAKRYAKNFPRMWYAGDAGQAVEFKFKGKDVKIFDLVGPTCGRIKVSVDGQDKGTRDRFDSYCTYYRLQTMGIASGLSADAVHTIRLEIAEETPDKRKVLQQRAEANASVLALDDAAFTKKFDGRDWYAGMIMVRGELVK